MNQEQAIDLIEQKYLVNANPVFVYSEDGYYLGYFQDFADAAALKNEKKYRLVPLTLSKRLKDEHENSQLLDTRYSVIIDTSKVRDIRESMRKEGADALLSASKNYSNKIIQFTDGKTFKFESSRLTLTLANESDIWKESYDKVDEFPYGIKELLEERKEHIYCIELDAQLVELTDNLSPTIRYANLEHLLSTFGGEAFDIRMS
jgi:hypothetical protein